MAFLSKKILKNKLKSILIHEVISMGKKKRRSSNMNLFMQIGIIISVIGAALMIYYGSLHFFNPSQANTNYLINIPQEFQFLAGIISIVAGALVIVITARNRPDANDDLGWVILTIILGAVGSLASVSAGVIVFVGAIIYLIIYFF